MSERRGVGRVRTFLRGRISYNNGSSTMDCLVRDLSAGGARIALDGAMTLPEVFDLIIPQKGVTRRCRLCWRREDEIGVGFLDEVSQREVRPVTDPSMVDLLVRIRLLEAENESLRMRLATLQAPALAIA